jgi:hypothetical protein
VMAPSMIPRRAYPRHPTNHASTCFIAELPPARDRHFVCGARSTTALGSTASSNQPSTRRDRWRLGRRQPRWVSKTHAASGNIPCCARHGAVTRGSIQRRDRISIAWPRRIFQAKTHQLPANVGPTARGPGFLGGLTLSRIIR